MRTMGVDLSTQTGICVMAEGKKLLVASEISYPLLTGHEREEAIFQTIHEVWEQYAPNLLLIETAITSAKFISATQQSLAAVVRHLLWSRDVAYKDVSPSSLKKFVTGAGNTKKEMVMLSLHVQWGIKTSSNNIADAVGLALFGQCVLGDTEFKSPQKQVVKTFLQVKTPKTRGSKSKNECN